jgi:hypothetical protein
VPRPVAIVLVLCAAAAASLTLGSALGSGPSSPVAGPAHPAHLTAAASPLAGLNATFRRLAPEARCDKAAAKARTARRLRAEALRNAAKAKPKVLRAKKRKLRRAIRLLRSGAKLCDQAPPPGGGSPGAGAAPPAPGAPPPPPPPPPQPGTQTISLSASGTTLAFSPNTPVTVSPGTIRLALANNSSLDHRIGARTSPGNVLVGQQSPVASPGNSTFVDVTLAAGSYQIFCGVSFHAANGMVVPLTVTP